MADVGRVADGAVHVQQSVVLFQVFSERISNSTL
jgi:hypothetical protein